jgi:hypothetical protein
MGPAGDLPLSTSQASAISPAPQPQSDAEVASCHRRRQEEALRSLSGLGHARLGVAPGTVAGLEAYAREEGVDPDEWEAGAGYAADLGRLGRAVDWPPPRNGPCWCGSGNKYKKCCGSPAFLYSD